MEKNKNAMTGLLAVGLCLGLLWGVSPSMAASSFPLYKTDKVPSVHRPYVQPLQGQPQKPPKPGAGSLLVKPFNTKNSNLNPAYGKNSANTSKFNHTDAGRGSANINIGQPVTLDPKGTQQNVPKAIQAEQAYKAKEAMINKIGTPFGTNPKWNHGGGGGGHGGGNGALSPPTQVPVSTAPTPPPGQSNQAPQPNGGPPPCNPAVDICVR